MTFLRRLHVFLRGQHRLMAATIAFGIVFAGAGLVAPLLVRQILVWHAEGAVETGALSIIIVVLVGSFVLRAVGRYGYGAISHIVAYRAQHLMLVTLYRHIQSLPHRFFEQRRTGNLISRAVGDVEAVEDFIAHGIPEATLAATIPTAMVIALGIINWQLMLISLIPMPLILLLTWFVMPRLRTRWGNVRQHMAEITGAVAEGISGFAVVKAFGREPERRAEIDRAGARFRDTIVRTQALTLIPVGVLEIIAGLGLVLIVAVGGNWTLEGIVPVADLFVFVVYLGMIYQPIIQVAAIGEDIQKAIASTDRIFALLDVRSNIVDRPNARPPENPRWTVQFDQVEFAYDRGAPVLHGVDFTVPEGSLVALVGPTGAGKTTCTSLIPRFYDIDGGAVRISGVDVRDLPIDWLRSNISMVLQDVFLFEGSIWDNIAFGRPGATDAEILAAARAANVDEFAERLPGGYDARVGERGVRLSGGQQQRISIARSILKDAPILILDEATSSVDTETEGLIQESLSQLTKGRTTIVIAHRLSTVRSADHIVGLADGRVAETGSHDELLAQGGWYARMYEIQAGTALWQIGERKAVPQA
ncbi:MAG: ABC transporter ATP-binding protein [Chloroflexi bacterium]|nr:ABC transporter ATP-binding protein [Chloroflexota bacterium]